MASKWCPVCGRIVTMSGVPRFCAWGCGSLQNEPLLPPPEEWTGGYYGMIEIARREWEKREAEKEPPSIEISPGRLQMRLF